MRPTEIKEQILELPTHSNFNIIILTGSSLRHKRFALKLQKEFPDLIAAWYQIDKNMEPKYQYGHRRNIKKGISHRKKFTKLIKILKNQISNFLIDPNHIYHTFKTFYNFCLIRNFNKKFLISEKNIFDYEMESLKKFAIIKSTTINPIDLNTPQFCKTLKDHNAYFIVSLGGPLLSNKVIESINGVALNQHSGHSPNYRGSKTIEWALYHRDIKSLSNTVHLTTTSADSGPIIRRSNICLHPDDNPHDIFFKSVALGTELIIEVIKEIISKKNILVFKQPKFVGKTYLSKELSGNILVSIIKDFKNKWLMQALYKKW